MRKEKLQVEEETLSERLIKYLATRKDEQFGALSVSSLADAFNIHRSKLSRTFKVERKITLDDYLANEKMYRSAFILMSGEDISIKELARLMGFRTDDYFVRVFKRYFGLSPRQYKEYRTERSGIEDRRVGFPDRRVNANSPIPKSGDRRKGQKDRRMGPGERNKGLNNRGKVERRKNSEDRRNSVRCPEEDM
ncbi:MAG: helix-turn-helix transcriptional regulator [Candidatus Aminicenantes bacterium]|nr:helix-turn-helix transcriptional regulator [Candidatus Aminicenantes bacterium]